MKKSLKTLALACLTLIAATTMGQTAFPALGGDASGSTGSFSYTVGQIETQGIYTAVSGNHISGFALTEGVQQTYPENELGIEEITPTDFAISVYPNPTSTGIVTVELTQNDAETHYELFATNGRLAQSGILQSNKQKIDISGCAAGTYVLRVSNNETGHTHSFRIIKMR